ncbi:hypothetical protein [Deinococcus sp.]|uniref:hypothetical protein n=1 Tax=Deinococcus sp. TaxID=47478 RepID=UPI0025C44014|nr:hypothetical protein [Deinococcus sp.]
MKGHVRRCFAYSFAPDEVEGRLHEYGLSLLQAHYESGLRGRVLRRAVEADVDLLSCVASFAAEVGVRAEQRGEPSSGEDVMTPVSALFVTKGPAVRLCTVHKAGGLAAARVRGKVTQLSFKLTISTPTHSPVPAPAACRGRS